MCSSAAQIAKTTHDLIVWPASANIYVFLKRASIFVYCCWWCLYLKTYFAKPAKAILRCPSNAFMCANTSFLTKNGQSDNITVIHHRQRWPQSFRRVRQSFRPVLPSIKPSNRRSKIGPHTVCLAGLVQLV